MARRARRPSQAVRVAAFAAASAIEYRLETSLAIVRYGHLLLALDRKSVV